jgi:predicted metal-dependent hydrolase
MTPIRRRQSNWTDTAFRARVHGWADRIGVKPVEIRLRPMRRKWASCSSRGRLTFDTALLRCECEFGDFVIVHELLHLQVPNHGKLFKSLLTALIPGWHRFEGRHQQHVAEATILRTNDRAKQ